MLAKTMALSAGFVLAACTQVAQAPAPVAPSRDDIVHTSGHDGFKFGANRAEVIRFVNQDLQGCNAQLRDRPEGSLVFGQDERLVLLWFDAPLRTPDGVNTGDALSEAQTVYPNAVVLTAPPGSHRFDGLLVSAGEYGYLFLHDGQTVRKAIAGYVDYLYRLFDAGFGVC